MGARWCGDCQKNVQVLDGVVCDVCGLPQKKAGTCDVCLEVRPHFRSLRAWAAFEKPVQSALHRLKYKRDISLGDALASEMIPFVRRLGWQIDVVVPVPLGKQRMRERGYNQVAMVAKPLALALGYQYAPNGLVRYKETRSQVGLSREERRANVHEVFQVGMEAVGKVILIMDDVSTTGSTLSSGAAAFHAAGARDVFALTVARALPHHDLRRV